jgi:hypothetical protein
MPRATVQALSLQLRPPESRSATAARVAAIVDHARRQGSCIAPIRASIALMFADLRISRLIGPLGSPGGVTRRCAQIGV